MEPMVLRRTVGTVEVVSMLHPNLFADVFVTTMGLWGLLKFKVEHFYSVENSFNISKV